MKVKLTGEQARTNYEAALKLVKEGKYEEARKVDLLPSDRTLILLKIVQATKP